VTHPYETHEGILLSAIPYMGSQHRILRIFTPDMGLLSLIVKNIKGKWSWTTPFCKAEWVFHKSQNDLHLLKDATLIDPLFKLREGYDAILAASSIAGDLLRSQFPHKSSVRLYALLDACLRHLLINPTGVAQVFRLKLLQTEGLLQLQSTCARCSLPSSHLCSGESLCTLHASSSAQHFENSEWELLLFLSQSRRFSELESLRLSPHFLSKTEKLFIERLR
jgi:DNA repair protein RecO (recombination protein O)